MYTYVYMSIRVCFTVIEYKFYMTVLCETNANQTATCDVNVPLLKVWSGQRVLLYNA